MSVRGIIPKDANPDNLDFSSRPQALNSQDVQVAVIDENNGLVYKAPYLGRPVAVISSGLNSPPVNAGINDSYIVGTSPTGDWVGQSNAIATYSGAGWNFYTPVNGDNVVILTGSDAGSIAKFTTSWAIQSPSQGVQGTAALNELYDNIIVAQDGTVKRRYPYALIGEVISNTVTTPPQPVDGVRYIVPASGVTGAWVGNENKIAIGTGNGWVYYTPVANDSCVITTGANAGFVIRFGTSWAISNRFQQVSSPVSKPPSVGSFFVTTYSQSILVNTITSGVFQPVSPYFVSGLLTAAPTGANLAGHYIQISGTPTVGALNDVIYWNGTTATLEFTYANAGNTVGVGSNQSTRQTYTKNGSGGWVLVGSSAVSPFIGATASTSGVQGIVPAPLAGQQNAFLKNDGWQNIEHGTLQEDQAAINGTTYTYNFITTRPGVLLMNGKINVYGTISSGYGANILLNGSQVQKASTSGVAIVNAWISIAFSFTSILNAGNHTLTINYITGGGGNIRFPSLSWLLV